MTAKLLLIDGDVTLCTSLKELLLQKGYQVEVASNGARGLQKVYLFHPDALILDVELPDMDGWEVCRRIREMADIPIILHTRLGSGEDILKGLGLGVDHYIVKPVTDQEVVAHIQAVLRRVYRQNYVNGKMNFAFGGVLINYYKHEVTVDGRRIDLTPTEFRLLSCLAQHSGRVLSHEFLLSNVWGPEYNSGEADHVRLYISRLRRKMNKKMDQPQTGLISTEWGLGYRLG
jgi:two-component system, OmpR family, KDP operon response regulator KdpE